MSTPRNPAPKTERTIRLQGVAETYEEGDGLVLRRCALTPGTGSVPAVFVASWLEEGALWEMKLTSPDGVLFAGTMSAKGRSNTRVEMTLWSTAARDRWLLDGVYHSTEGEQRWMFTLSRDDEA